MMRLISAMIGLWVVMAAPAGALAHYFEPDSGLAQIAQCEAAEGEPLVFGDSDGFQTRVTQGDPGLLCVDGAVTDAFADWYVPRADQFGDVVIRSLGGRGAAGVRTGEAALQAGTHVVVWDYCISACANGLVIGAARVTVPEPAILAWHGSLPRDRFEAVLLSAGGTPKLRTVQSQLLAQHRQSGNRSVTPSQWAALPEDQRDLFDDRARWRGRIVALLEARGLHPDFLAASAFAARYAPAETQALAVARAGSLAPILWVPSPSQLNQWGLTHIKSWAPTSPDLVYELGLAMTPPMALTSVNLEAGAFYKLDPTQD